VCEEGAAGVTRENAGGHNQKQEPHTKMWGESRLRSHAAPDAAKERAEAQLGQ